MSRGCRELSCLSAANVPDHVEQRQVHREEDRHHQASHEDQYHGLNECCDCTNPDVELRRTSFDTKRSAEALLSSGWPSAQSFVEENVRAAVPREEAVKLFEQIAATDPEAAERISAQLEVDAGFRQARQGVAMPGPAEEVVGSGGWLVHDAHHFAATRSDFSWTDASSTNSSMSSARKSASPPTLSRSSP